jgi:beta-lactamase regulating signal transducer with metallopeptidase domain/predicted  nucleic acid-binding Zn-ribbon protein
MSALLPGFVSALGWALIDFIWQGVALGLATAIALAALSNARPQTRYLIACVALALCIALPAGGVWRAMTMSESSAYPTTPIFATIVANTSTLTMASTRSWRASLQTQLPWIVLLWSLGAGVLTLRTAVGCAWVRRLGAHAAVGDPHWQQRLDRLAISIGIPRPIALRLSRDLDSPVAAGCWRPIVLVPLALLTDMPADLLEALLAHELAHIKRHDYLVNLLQSAIEALLFYHPVVWWLSRRIRIEREQIADDLALQAIKDPRRLALALQQLDRFQAGLSFSPTHTLAPAAHGGNLMSRIQRLLRPNRRALSWTMALPILALTAVCLTVYAQGVEVAPASKNDKLQIFSDKNHQSYALVREGQDGMMLSGSTDDIVDVKKLRQHMHGDFLWFRRNGEAYVVQDPAVLAKARDAWKDADAVGARMESVEVQMRPYSEKLEALSKQMEALDHDHDPINAQMEETSRRMEPLSRQQEALGLKMEKLGERVEASKSDAEREQLSREMEALQKQMEPLSAQMEQISAVMERQSAEMEKAAKPMEALGKQMEAASKPMEPFEKQLEAMGKEEEKLSAEADRQVKLMIDEAVRNGKATPTDAIVGK